MDNKYYHRGSGEVVEIPHDFIIEEPFVFEMQIAILPVIGKIEMPYYPVGWVGDDVEMVWQMRGFEGEDWVTVPKGKYKFLDSKFTRILFLPVNKVTIKSESHVDLSGVEFVQSDYTKEAEELYRPSNKSSVYETLIKRQAHIAARQQSAAEIDRLRQNCSANHVNIDDLLTVFNNAGFDTSNWDGEEGVEQALVDGVKNEIDRLRGEVERLKDLINTVAGDFFAAGLRRAKSKNPETLNLVDYKEYYFKQNNIQ